MMGEGQDSWLSWHQDSRHLVQSLWLGVQSEHLEGGLQREAFFLGLEITLLISPSLEVSELIWEREECDVCLPCFSASACLSTPEARAHGQRGCQEEAEGKVGCS